MVRTLLLTKSLATLLILASSVTLPCSAKTHAPASPTERTQVLDYVRSLEDNPVSMDSLNKRLWLSEWIVQSPDITVTDCCKSLQALDEVNPTYSNQLRMQAIFSQAAFMLQHPHVKNVTQIQAAGLAGTLRAYRAIQRFDPSAKYPLLDDLLALQKQGKLSDYVEQQHEKSCSME